MKCNVITLTLVQPLPDPMKERDAFNEAMDCAERISKESAAPGAEALRTHTLAEMITDGKAQIESVKVRTLMSRRGGAAQQVGDSPPPAPEGGTQAPLQTQHPSHSTVEQAPGARYSFETGGCEPVPPPPLRGAHHPEADE